MLSGATLAFPGLRAAVLGLDALALLCFALDFLLAPRPDRLGVRRELPLSAGLSTDFVRVLHVDPRGVRRAGGRVLELREEFPAACEVAWRTDVEAEGAGERVSGAPAAPGAPGADGRPAGTATDGPGAHRAHPRAGDPTGGPDRVRLGDAPLGVRRAYRSALRGVHAFGDLRLRLPGPLGLVQRQARLVGRQEVAVEPALAGLKRTLALAASERWQDLGVRRLRRRGGQTEFESLRDYVHGDEVRRVDWKAFARRGKPTVRQYQEERGQELILLVDVGRTMRATSESGALSGWTKLDWALDASLQLAAVALQAGDRVGCALFDDKLRAYVDTARGSRQLARLREAVFDRLPSTHASDLARALREIAVRHRRRALVLVLSDVADPLSVERQRGALAAASRRHRLVFAALDDPDLRALAEGRGGADHPSPGALRASALELVEDRRRSLRRLAGAGVRVLDALPAEAAGPLLAAWLDERRAS